MCKSVKKDKIDHAISFKEQKSEKPLKRKPSNYLIAIDRRKLIIFPTYNLRIPQESLQGGHDYQLNQTDRDYWNMLKESIPPPVPLMHSYVCVGYSNVISNS